MIIFLYGPDTYRSRQKLNEVVGHYKKIHKSGLDLKYFDLREEDFQDFKGQFQSVSMFAGKKLFILEDVSQNKDFKERFLENAKKFANSENAILFYEAGEAPKDKFFASLKKIGECQEFKSLEGQKLRNWVRKELKEYGSEINEKALNKLIDFVGNNLWQMGNEIKKLASYKNKKKIEEEDIELLVKPEIETDIFKTIDALAARNKKQAIELLHEHIDKGDSPLYLLSMINFQFRNLLIIKDLIEKRKPFYAFSKETGLHPYVIKKSCNSAQKFTFQELKKIYQKIFQVDLGIKTGRIEPGVALDVFIAEI